MSKQSNILLRNMGQLVSAICNYDYAVENYSGNGTVMEDRKNEVCKQLALVKYDLNAYIDDLGLTEEVNNKVEKRAKKLEGRK